MLMFIVKKYPFHSLTRFDIRSTMKIREVEWIMGRLQAQIYDRKQLLSHVRVRAVNYFPSTAENGAPRPVNAHLCSSGCKNCPWVDFKDYEECGLRFLKHSSL